MVKQKPTWEQFSDDGVYRPHLLSKEVLDKIESGKWRRAGGAVICTSCNLSYSEHQLVPNTGGLRQLCNNDLVHL